jgi:hypothetical protein
MALTQDERNRIEGIITDRMTPDAEVKRLLEEVKSKDEDAYYGLVISAQVRSPTNLAGATGKPGPGDFMPPHAILED